MSYFDIITGGQMVAIVEYDQNDEQVGQPTYFPAGGVSVRWNEKPNTIVLLNSFQILAELPLEGIRFNGNPDDYSGIATNLGSVPTTAKLAAFDPDQNQFVDLFATNGSLWSYVKAQDAEDPQNYIPLQSESGLLKCITQRIDTPVVISKPIPLPPVVFPTNSIGTAATFFLNGVPERRGIMIENGTDQTAYFKWNEDSIVTSGASRSYHFQIAAGARVELLEIDTTKKLYVKFATSPNSNGILMNEFV